MNNDIWATLRKPFPAEQIGKLPRGGTQLDYVGHADVTSRLLEADPAWNWEPVSSDENGMPRFDLDDKGRPVGLWIKLTAGGVTRMGYGSCPSNQSDAVKVLIGDALRNAAMRFGVALDLWAKGDRANPAAENPSGSAGHARRGQSAGDVFEQSRPASQGPRGQVTRPTVQAVPEPAETDDDAQELAGEAHAAQVIADLRSTWKRAKETAKLNAVINDPGTGEKVPLVQFIDARRREFEDVDAALKEFHTACEAQRMPVQDMEEHVKRATGADFEKATAAQLRQAIAALKGAAA